MITEIHFQNFKALRDTTLPLGRMNLLIGPNGSGKSSVFQGIQASVGSAFGPETVNTLVKCKDNPAAATAILWTDQGMGLWCNRGLHSYIKLPESYVLIDESERARINHVIQETISSFRYYSFDAHAIAQPSALVAHTQLAHDGGKLPVVLDQLRDRHPERFEQINAEVARCLPEFDRILFSTPAKGDRSIALRQKSTGQPIQAAHLSQGTLIALAILTLAYLPEPPRIVGLEEPDRGIHPRLLRDIRDAMYRLAYPENYGEKREPVQVIATTHSPIFLDLFRDHPEEIIIANRTEDNVKFERLSERPDLDELLGDASLGDVWYTGVLGGVPDR